jgi:exportin-5
LEWEAVVAVIDGVLSRILLVTERPSVLTGLTLLEECLKVHSNDPLIQSILLSCISSLFVFLSMSSSAGNVALNGAQLLPRVLDKIFSSFHFQPGPQAQSQIRSVAVKNLRRHAASSVVKIALKYPLLLLPIFDQISTTIQTLIVQENQLTGLEKITLQVSVFGV